jgi:hypothetical protein
MSLVAMELACHMKTVSEVHACIDKVADGAIPNAKNPIVEFTTNNTSKTVSSMELPE